MRQAISALTALSSSFQLLSILISGGACSFPILIAVTRRCPERCWALQKTFSPWWGAVSYGSACWGQRMAFRSWRLRDRGRKPGEIRKHQNMDEKTWMQKISNLVVWEDPLDMDTAKFWRLWFNQFSLYSDTGCPVVRNVPAPSQKKKKNCSCERFLQDDGQLSVPHFPEYTLYIISMSENKQQNYLIHTTKWFSSVYLILLMGKTNIRTVFVFFR